MWGTHCHRKKLRNGISSGTFMHLKCISLSLYFCPSRYDSILESFLEKSLMPFQNMSTHEKLHHVIERMHWRLYPPFILVAHDKSVHIKIFFYLWDLRWHSVGMQIFLTIKMHTNALHISSSCCHLKEEFACVCHIWRYENKIISRYHQVGEAIIIFVKHTCDVKFSKNFKRNCKLQVNSYCISCIVVAYIFVPYLSLYLSINLCIHVRICMILEGNA